MLIGNQILLPGVEPDIEEWGDIIEKSLKFKGNFKILRGSFHKKA
jgi:hypothetical protein